MKKKFNLINTYISLIIPFSTEESFRLLLILTKRIIVVVSFD